MSLILYLCTTRHVVTVTVPWRWNQLSFRGAEQSQNEPAPRRLVARYRVELQTSMLQLRLMALGLLMLEQNILGTILLSAFLLQPKRVYCFPGDDRPLVTTQRVRCPANHVI